jgi:predicted lipid-binding transport protein (Tim44 family)
MKNFFIALMIAISGMSLVAADAEARRLGGGGSFGKQSQGISRQAPTQSSQATKPAAPAGATAPAASPWRGILGGALLGLGLGALLSHLGIGGALASIISAVLTIGLLALVAMFIYRMVAGRKNGPGNGPQPSYAGAYSARNSTPEIGSRVQSNAQPSALQADSLAASGAAVSNAPWGVPDDFDVQAFIRNAKTYFIRLQAAWDRADINDIREFTTPEMFAELKMQLQERGASPNNTDVVSLDAELLGIETISDEYLASVKFTGMIREEDNAPAAPFSEVWNLSKPVSGQGGWALAGIQQLQ